MSIFVVCPGCRSRFQVSEKFAGRSGPCPKCKQVLKIPTPDQEVKVHTPQEFGGGGRNAAGKLVLKPIARTEVRLPPATIALIAAGSLAVLLLTWLAGELIQESVVVRLLGLAMVSPPLVFAAYTFLRDDELDPYRGRPLYLRIALCSLTYIALWAALGVASGRLPLGEEPWMWIVVGPPLIVAGALGALACFDLDFPSALFHYGFYLLATILLRWAAGMPSLWQVGS